MNFTNGTTRDITGFLSYAKEHTNAAFQKLPLEWQGYVSLTLIIILLIVGLTSTAGLIKKGATALIAILGIYLLISYHGVKL